MKAAGKPTDKPNLITGPVQVCRHKFARYFDVELREIPLERGRIGMTPDNGVMCRFCCRSDLKALANSDSVF